MVIGTDFDNTVVSYDGLFGKAIDELGIEMAAAGLGKAAIRDELRKIPGGELLWQRVQSLVYGPMMQYAKLFDGFRDFVLRCRQGAVPVYIVSHKTEYAAQDATVNLREQAMIWMENRLFFTSDGLGFDRDDIYFCATREEKLAKVAELECSHFVDDLVEVLQSVSFPQSVTPILMRSDQVPACGDGDLARASTWDEASRLVFG